MERPEERVLYELGMLRRIERACRRVFLADSHDPRAIDHAARMSVLLQLYDEEFRHGDYSDLS